VRLRYRTDTAAIRLHSEYRFLPPQLIYRLWPHSTFNWAGEFLSDNRKTKTILVVEDVGEISFQMGEMLRKKGHRILNAANAEEAIQIAERDRPNMILTDLDLPTFDALVRLVSTHKALGRLPVAIIDINGSEIEQQDGLKVLSNFDQLDELLESFVG
jgi:CheY-like chemotaxis protein